MPISLQQRLCEKTDPRKHESHQNLDVVVRSPNRRGKQERHLSVTQNLMIQYESIIKAASFVGRFEAKSPAGYISLRVLGFFIFLKSIQQGGDHPFSLSSSVSSLLSFSFSPLVLTVIPHPLFRKGRSRKERENLQNSLINTIPRHTIISINFV